MQSYTGNSENIIWKELLDSIQTFAYDYKEVDNIQDIVNTGLEVFSTIPNCISSSVFLINNDTYEFEYKNSIGIEKSEVIDRYLSLLEGDVIAQALNSDQLTYHDYNEKEVLLVFPLIAGNSIIGLAIIFFEKTISEMGQIVIDLCRIHISQFANHLYSSNLMHELKSQKSLLEQRIALKTKDLESAYNNLQYIFDTVQTGIMIVNTDSYYITYVNLAAAKIIGMHKSQIINQSAFNFLLLDNSIFSKSFINLECSIKSASDNISPILVNSSEIAVDSSLLKIISFVDITAIKEAEQNIISSLLKEKELNFLKTKFISIVSHEYRTPLTTIKSSAQLLEMFIDKWPKEKMAEHLIRIQHSVDFMIDMLNNVLLLNKKETNNFHYNPSEFELISYCNQIKNEIMFGYQERQVEFIASTETKSVEMDKILLNHIITNLLTNSLKYSPLNTPVSFHITIEDDYAVFVIKDLGIGIADDEQKQLFQPFYRASNVGTISGTGLGLSIVKNCVELHKGSIVLVSNLNQGSEFTVTLPTKKHE